MRVKRLFAAVLAAALLASLTALPAGAAPSSFSDISDQTTAVNADILRLMGVVNGTGGNMFTPNGTLTRAEFCTMLVNFLQKGDEARRYATQTIFTDVKSTHWARACINYAASTATGDSGVRLVSGVGDGRFLPDRNITMGEAATILLRALGYSGKDAGAVWPQGYMDLAASIGLSRGLSAGAYDGISRSQAAQLFVNALKCRKQDGTVYYKSLGNTVEKTIILAVNVETDDGSSKGAIRTSGNSSSEAYLPAQGSGNVPALQGKRGDLVLNERGDQIIAFVPDNSTAATITLSGDAQAAYVKASGGRQYTISGNTPVYTSSATESQPYLEARGQLVSGTQITMYSEKGKIAAIYATSAATSIDSDAVVVMGGATTASFHQLTGGVTDFKIIKNRQTISLSDIKEYDVVTYDRLSNTLVVSDLRLTCVYGDASPNVKTPQTVTVSKDKFEVLESAWESCASFKPGDTVTLLLTADGKVAGMAASGKARSTAVGFVDGGSVRLFLPNGGSRTLESTLTGTASLDSQLVTLTLNRNGVSASRLSGHSTSGTFEVNRMKLGSYTVAVGVRIYEQVSGGAMVAVDRGGLGMSSIPAGQIASYHLNSSNMVDYIVLNDVTGDAYEYGMMVAVFESKQVEVPKKDANGDEIKDKDGNVETTTETRTEQTWKLVRGSGEIEFVSSAGYSGRSGDMVGVVPGTPMGDGAGSTIKAAVKLTEVKNVKPGDFFESQGVPYVTVSGRTCRIADEVECCRNMGSSPADANWLSGAGAQRLASIKAYADSFTVYVDPVGSQVRVIKAN